MFCCLCCITLRSLRHGVLSVMHRVAQLAAWCVVPCCFLFAGTATCFWACLHLLPWVPPRCCIIVTPCKCRSVAAQASRAGISAGKACWRVLANNIADACLPSATNLKNMNKVYETSDRSSRLGGVGHCQQFIGSCGIYVSVMYVNRARRLHQRKLPHRAAMRTRFPPFAGCGDSGRLAAALFAVTSCVVLTSHCIRTTSWRSFETPPGFCALCACPESLHALRTQPSRHGTRLRHDMHARTHLLQAPAPCKCATAAGACPCARSVVAHRDLALKTLRLASAHAGIDQTCVCVCV